MLEDLTWYPNEQIVRFIVKYLKKRTGLNSWDIRRQAWKVLDLGCGTGRHVKLFSEQGFDTYGVDIAFINVEFSRNWMASLEMPARLVVGSSCRLPYRSKSFDVVVSHGVLDHMTLREARDSVEEVRRLLNPEGLFYVDLISKQDGCFGQGTMVEVDTFVVPDGLETGAVQRFYDEEGIQDLLSDAFVIREIVFQEWHPVLGRGFSCLDKAASGPLRLARYHLVAVPRGGEHR